MRKLNQDQAGFIPMMITIIAIVFGIIIFSYLRLKAGQ